jgi:NhaP-type Na+/H+ or K+/H+ antiporter
VSAVVVTFCLLVLAFAATTRRLSRAYVTAPVVFLAAGALLQLLVSGDGAELAGPFTVLAEVTLALVLFHDAAQVRPRQIGADRGPELRLLLIGLPLTILLGWGAALLLFPGAPVVLALLLAASLAPTDAGLGAATVLDPAVPVRVRRLLNVESGLNDGLATPVVLFAIAALAGSEGLGPVATVGSALVALLVGVGVGVAAGAGSGVLLGRSRRHGWSTGASRSLAVLAIPVLAYFAADLVGGNAFVASFVAGTAFTGAAAWAGGPRSPLHLTEALSEPLGFAIWFAFGFAALPLVVSEIGPRELAYALASLTVLRMAPVALVLLGTGLRAPTVAFIGWFGPRGLASVVFGMLALEGLADDEPLRQVLATIALTVMLSILAHGMSAAPLAARYSTWVARVGPVAETAPDVEPAPRRSLMHRWAVPSPAPQASSRSSAGGDDLLGEDP